MADGNFLQGNQTLVVFSALVFFAASFVIWRGGVLGRYRAPRKAEQRKAIRKAVLLARLQSARGPGRSSKGVKFWRKLFADMESASREDEISWEVVLAVTEAVQAEACRTAKHRAVTFQRPDAGLLARAGTRFSRASTHRRRKVTRWSSRRARPGVSVQGRRPDRRCRSHRTSTLPCTIARQERVHHDHAASASSQQEQPHSRRALKYLI
ncbi:hypothetical protein P3T23_009082 [Paraburkholderia sp. GAS448]